MDKRLPGGLIAAGQTVLLILVIPLVIKPLWEWFTDAQEGTVLGFATLADPWTVIVPVLFAVALSLAMALLERAKRRD